MPLPKEYYDILKSGDRPLTAPAKPVSNTMFPNIMPDPVDETGSAWDNVGDFLWSAGEGFVSGVTWGGSDYLGLTGEESWEEMPSAERAGYIAGEGAAFFAPFGPFAALGYGSRALAKAAGANKYIGKAAQQAAEKARKEGFAAKLQLPGEMRFEDLDKTAKNSLFRRYKIFKSF